MSRIQGGAAEVKAAAYLEAQGLRVLETNYHCRRGEIDIIAEEGDMLVFVEVKQRRYLSDAAVSIHYRKQQRLTAAASHYLSGSFARPCRFDAVLFDKDNNVEWIRGAFDAC